MENSIIRKKMDNNIHNNMNVKIEILKYLSTKKNTFIVNKKLLKINTNSNENISKLLDSTFIIFIYNEDVNEFTKELCDYLYNKKIKIYKIT